MYRSQSLSPHKTGQDHLVLSKTAILLSLWNPRDAQTEANTFWVERANNNLTAAIPLFDRSSANKVRLPILYWCCLIRNTLVAYAMRRQYRYQPEGRELFTPEDAERNFGREAVSPVYLQPTVKRKMISLFVWTCQLCKILNSVMASQRGSILNQNMKAMNSVDREDDDERWRAAALDDRPVKVFETEVFETKLKALYRRYENTMARRSTKSERENPLLELYEAGCIVHVYTLQIITMSVSSI